MEEDDNPTAYYVAKGLKEAGMSVQRAADGRAALDMLIGEDFDCVILDIMLPFIDGMTLLKTFRASNALTPVIMLTAKDAVEDRVRGLSGGADDYLVKPFAFSELLARIHAVTRRRGAPAPQARLSAEDLEMDSVKHTVTRGGKSIELTNEHYTSLLADGEGKILDQSEHFPFSYAQFMELLPQDSRNFFWRSPEGERFLLGRRTVFGDAGTDGYVLVARNLEKEYRRKYRLLQASCWFTLFTAAVIGLLSFAFAKMTLSPLSRMGGYIGAITAKDLHRRLHAQSWPAELRPLARAFDRMLARLEDNFIRLNRFSTDLAHELRTPIHQLRMALEVTLSKSRSKAEYEDSLSSQLESVARLNRLVEELLFVARAESGESAVQKTRVDIAATAEKVKDFFQDSLDEQQVEMDLSAAHGLLHADGQMLLRALVNLTANALRYVPRGGHIRIGAEQEKGETVITFFNDGPAIGPEHMGRLFDRFYKIDSPRPSPDGYGGSGLGLSIVASIMKLHGGRAEVHNAKGGKGVVFRLVFPSKN